MRSFILAASAAILWNSTAFAEPVTLTCEVTQSSVYSLSGRTVSPATINLPPTTIVVDLDHAKLHMNNQDLPIGIGAERIIAIQHVDGEPAVFGTYDIDRRTGLYQSFLHLLIKGSPISAVNVGQCHTGSGGTGF